MSVAQNAWSPDEGWQADFDEAAFSEPSTSNVPVPPSTNSNGVPFPADDDIDVGKSEEASQTTNGNFVVTVVTPSSKPRLLDEDEMAAKDDEPVDPDFNSYNYWKTTLPPLDLPPLS